MAGERLKRLFQTFSREGIDALLVSSPPNVSYLSGFKGTESWILAGPEKRYFITDSRYKEQAAKEAPGFEIVLRDKKGVAELAGEFCGRHGWRRLGFESAVITHAFFTGLVRKCPRKLVPTRALVEGLRLTKDSGEIRLMKKAAAIAVDGYYHVKKTARPGMTEREIQGSLEYHMKKGGAEKPAFDLIIAAGSRSSMPHCQSNESRVKPNNILLVDMGAVYGGYFSDLTRPVFLGKINGLQRKICKIVWDAQRAGIAKAGPGVPAREVDAACRRHIEAMGYGGSFGHGTGHGVGLEIHEAPSVSSKSQTILRPGMVITVEPGIYLPGRFGVRIEDMVLITEKGREVLTKALDNPTL